MKRLALLVAAVGLLAGACGNPEPTDAVVIAMHGKVQPTASQPLAYALANCESIEVTDQVRAVAVCPGFDLIIPIHPPGPYSERFVGLEQAAGQPIDAIEATAMEIDESGQSWVALADARSPSLLQTNVDGLDSNPCIADYVYIYPRHASWGTFDDCPLTERVEQDPDPAEICRAVLDGQRVAYQRYMDDIPPPLECQLPYAYSEDDLVDVVGLRTLWVRPGANTANIRAVLAYAVTGDDIDALVDWTLANWVVANEYGPDTADELDHLYRLAIDDGFVAWTVRE